MELTHYLKMKISWIIGLFLFFITFSVDKNLAIGILFVVFLCLIVFYFLQKFKIEGKLLSKLFLIAILIHFGVVLFIYYAHFQPFNGGGGDYTSYQQQAQEIAERVQQGNFSLQGIEIGHFYPVIIGYIYAFTVPSILIGQLFNAWLVALSIIFVYLIVREVGGTEKESFLTGLIASVYPSLVFYGSLLLKDALVVLLSILGLFLTIKIIKNFSVLKFLSFFIVLTGLIHFRFYVGYALMFGFIISWFLSSSFNLKKRIGYGVIIFFLLGFSPQCVGIGYYGLGAFKSFLNIETITFYREVAYVPVEPNNNQPSNLKSDNSQPVFPPLSAEKESSTSLVIIKTGFENPLTFIKNTTLSFISSFLGPFPWQLTSLKQLFVLPEIIGWCLLLFFIVKGIIKSIKKQYKVILPVLLFSCLVFGVLAIFINNFGIITRIRMPAFLALLCLFPLGFKRLNDVKIPLLNKIFKSRIINEENALFKKI